MNAVLALEDGTWFSGTSVGAAGETSGEVVFNTSMTGYQEVLTDPSYAGQIVTMTSVQIGNYGVTHDDAESRGPQVAGFVMRESSPVASNWRADQTLRDYLTGHNIVAIADIDTRALTRKLRSGGVLRGVIATGVGLDPQQLVARAAGIRPMEGSDLVKDVTCAAPFEWKPEDESDPDFLVPPERRAARRLKIAAYDLGIKFNILRRLAAHNCDVTVFPASAPASQLLAIEPDGIFLSNGPGDPAALPYVVRERADTRGCRRAGVRHLPGPPGAGPGDGGQDLQVEVRTPRRQSPGEEPGDQQGRDHLAEPRVCGRPRFAAGPRAGHAPELV